MSKRIDIRAGVVVWARIPDHPWWPGVMQQRPTTGRPGAKEFRYVKLLGSGRIVTVADKGFYEFTASIGLGAMSHSFADGAHHEAVMSAIDLAMKHIASPDGSTAQRALVKEPNFEENVMLLRRRPVQISKLHQSPSSAPDAQAENVENDEGGLDAGENRSSDGDPLFPDSYKELCQMEAAVQRLDVELSNGGRVLAMERARLERVRRAVERAGNGGSGKKRPRSGNLQSADLEHDQHALSIGSPVKTKLDSRRDEKEMQKEQTNLNFWKTREKTLEAEIIATEEQIDKLGAEMKAATAAADRENKYLRGLEEEAGIEFEATRERLAGLEEEYKVLCNHSDSETSD